MGKNKRRQLEYFDEFHNNNVMCDSQEEIDFFMWCEEAATLKIIEDYEYQPNPILLFESIDYINFEKKKRNLFREHKYSPDFKLKFDPRHILILSKYFKIPFNKINQNNSKYNVEVLIDVKGTFQRNGGDRSFSINQKWVYQKTGIYISKVIPKDFFKECGCPKKAFITRKTRKQRKIYTGYKSILEKCKNKTSD